MYQTYLLKQQLWRWVLLGCISSINDKITLHWKRVGQTFSHLHSGISGILKRLFGGTKHYSPDSVGTYISGKTVFFPFQTSIFGAKVTPFKIGDDKKKDVSFWCVSHQIILSFQKLDILILKVI